MTTTYAWHPNWPAPAGVPVRQVYAWIVDDHGSVLLINMPGTWNLPGGTPEGTDADWEATVRREALEEADVILRDIVPLGYQLVTEDQQAPIAQLRVVARVDEWLDATPDPDNGIVYPREWVPLADAGNRLCWGPPGEAQAAAVAHVAFEVYALSAYEQLAQQAGRSNGSVVQQV